MPVAGAVGAISAANRASRNRRAGMGSATPYRSTFAYSAPPRKTTETSEKPASDSKSMLTMLKQQVQETGGYIKKKQQVLSEKVQRGLKMTSSLTTNLKKSSGLEEKSLLKDLPPMQPEPMETIAPTTTVAEAESTINPAWITALGDMGFDTAEVMDAATILGGPPEQMDDLLQVLVTMRASASTEPPTETGAAEMECTSIAAPSRPSLQIEEQEPSEPQPPLPPPVSPPSPCMPLPTQSAVGSVEFEMAAAEFAAASAPRGISAKAFQYLLNMGFDRQAIHQATAMLDRNASQEELFDILLAMGSPLSPPNSGTASSSTDGMSSSCAAASSIDDFSFSRKAAEPMQPLPPSMMPASAAASAPCQDATLEFASAVAAKALVMEAISEATDSSANNAVAVDALSDSEPDVVIDADVDSACSVEEVGADMREVGELDEMPIHTLAACVVSSAIAKAASDLRLIDRAAVQPKQVFEENFAASPVRGGA